jgi:hypothetical protein
MRLKPGNVNTYRTRGSGVLGWVDWTLASIISNYRSKSHPAISRFQ